jgi:uncharacterized protein YodC (DUF2158 family)
MGKNAIALAKTRPAWPLVVICMLALSMAVWPTAAQGSLAGFDPRDVEIDVGTAGANVIDDPIPGIDWKNFQVEGTLFSNHRITDGVGNADPDIVGPQDKLVSGSSLPKEDIYNLFLSNNVNYLYLAMARRSNNGNSNYHWFFTKISPTAISGQPIMFHLQNGDVEIRVCFPKGSAPQDFSAQVFQVVGLSPGQVVDVRASNIWSSVSLNPNPGAIGAFSINKVNTEALAGAIDQHGNPTTTYETAVFAEGSVSLSALGLTPCGTLAYVTVMTRSSCSLTSDLKDIAPPVAYVFGEVEVALGTPTVGCTTVTGAPVSLTATASGGSGSFVWTWPVGWGHVDSTDTTTSTGTATLTPGTPEICVRADCPAIPGCYGTACVTIPIPEQVQVSIGDATIECTTDSGAEVTLTANASGGVGPYSYAWSEGLSSLGTTNPLVHTFAAGDHTVKVDVTDSKGCTASAEKTFTVLPKVTVSIETPVIECTTNAGAQVTLTATPGGGDGSYTYKWYEGLTQIGTTNPLIHTFAPGEHTVKVVVADSRACEAEAQTTFTVLPKVQVSIGEPAIECTVEGFAPVTLTAIPTGGDGTFTCQWYEGLSVLGTGNPFDHSFPVGEHTVRVVVADGRGCQAEAQVTFTVLPGVTVSLQVIPPLDCVSSVTLRATASGGDGDYTYTWKVDDVVVSVDQPAGGGHSDYTVVFPDNEYCGARVVTVEVSDGRGCVNAAPSPSKTLTKSTAISAS